MSPKMEKLGTVMGLESLIIWQKQKNIYILILSFCLFILTVFIISVQTNKNPHDILYEKLFLMGFA